MAGNEYVTHKEFRGIKRSLRNASAEIKDIKENHLTAIARDIKNLRWFFMAGMVVLGIVLAILQVFG